MRRPDRVKLSRRRTLLAMLAVAVIVAIAVLADRTGLFGRFDNDLARYDGKTFEIARHIDGDTFAIAAPDGWATATTIRLWGVDTPETVKPNTPVQHFGPEASRFTKQMTDGQVVRLELLPRDTRDRYDRLLAYVFLPDGRMLNLLLVEGGYAYADPRFDHPHKVQFIDAMVKARRLRLGLWANVKAGDLPSYLRQWAASEPQ